MAQRARMRRRSPRTSIRVVRTAVLVTLLLSACARVGAVSVQPLPVEAPAITARPFRMGFTTARGGPAGGTEGAPAPTLRFIRANGDIVTVHRDGPPVPWNALADGRTTRFGRMLGRQRARIGSLPVFVSITPFNVFRNGIGGDWPDDLGP